MVQRPAMALGLVVTVAAVVIAGADARRLAYFGFYCDGDAGVDVAGGQAGNCNVACAANLTLLREARERGFSVGMASVRDAFFVDTFGPDGRWTGLRLRADWRAQWSARATALVPYMQHGVVSALFLGDELCWNGVAYEDLVRCADAVRAVFPALIVYYNEAMPTVVMGRNIFNASVPYAEVPRSIDWVSFDAYGAVADTRAAYIAHLYTKMAPHQRAMLVPDAYGSTHDPHMTLAEHQAVRRPAWAAADRARAVRRLTDGRPRRARAAAPAARRAVLPVGAAGRPHRRPSAVALVRAPRPPSPAARLV